MSDSIDEEVNITLKMNIAGVPFSIYALKSTPEQVAWLRGLLVELEKAGQTYSEYNPWPEDT